MIFAQQGSNQCAEDWHHAFRHGPAILESAYTLRIRLPCIPVQLGGSQQDLDCGSVEEAHRVAGCLLSLVRYRKDKLRQGCMLRLLHRDIAEERPDCGQAGVAAVLVVAALSLPRWVKLLEQSASSAAVTRLVLPGVR